MHDRLPSDEEQAQSFGAEPTGQDHAHPLSPEHLLRLQQTLGNQAVTRLIQRTRSTRSGQQRHRHRTRRMTGPAHPGRRVTDRQTRITGLNDLIDMTLVENVGGSGRLTQMASGRDVATSGGWVDYGAIVNGQRGAVQARITRSMIRQGSAATYNFPFIRRRMGYMVVRGHLLARVLGGSGADGRNLVPLPHSANNLPMYADIESRIQRYVERGGEVLFTAFPVYLGGAFPDPRSVLPTAIRVTATDATTGANVVSELFDCSW